MNAEQLALLAQRMADWCVDSVALFRNPNRPDNLLVRITGRWGCHTFTDLEKFNAWIHDADLPDNTLDIFAKFNPHLPN